MYHHRLDIQIDSSGLYRVGGRLARSDLPEELKHPIILPKAHVIIEFLLKHYHHKYRHQGYRVVLANLSQEEIIIPGGKEILKSIANSCIYCRIRRRLLLQQKMSDLPSFRAQDQCAPFAAVAVDFFGYLKVKLTRNSSANATVLIITCTTTRVIHLEMCLTEDFDSFFSCLVSFYSYSCNSPVISFL